MPAISEAANAVASGECDEGIFCCWSGTGASMVANKTSGLWAALCTDVETAQLSRIWNHANVLILSNRLLTADAIPSIVGAWFEPFDPTTGLTGVKDLKNLDPR